MDDHSPYACASTGEESPRGAHDNDRRGYWSRGTKPRRLASRVAVLASVAALGLMPVPAGTSARPADALLSADSTDANPESEASLGTASMRLKIEQSEFELLPKQKMFRHGHFQFDQWAPTDRYFGRVSITSNAADVPSVVFSMEGQPEQSSYQFCEYKRDDCQDVEIGVGDTSGHLYLHIDLGQARLGYRYGVTYVPDFPEQPVELAAAESGSALRVFREVLVKPSSRVPDCSDYEAATPQLFECLTLGELLLDNPPEVTAGVRDALPDLVQDRANYNLIFAEEFEGEKSQSPTGDCMTGMATIADNFNITLDPCTNVDASTVPVPCEEIENGYYYSALTSVCGSGFSTDGKFSFKYGYIEVKYEVPAYNTLGFYANSAVLGNRLPDLAHNHRKYGITIDSIEKLLSYEESEIDLIEYLPSSYQEVSHQYYNVLLSYDGYDSIRTDKNLYYCNPSSPDPTGIVLRLRVCGQRNQTIVVTKGLEWTPQGYITYYKVDDGSNADDRPAALRRSQIGVRTGKTKGYEHGPVCRDDVGQWLVPVDPDTTDNDPVVFEQVAVTHVPISLGHASWGFPKYYHNKVRSKFKIHYIRVFQPDNRYTDMEPVYPPLPVEKPVVAVSDRPRCS